MISDQGAFACFATALSYELGAGKLAPRDAGRDGDRRWAGDACFATALSYELGACKLFPRDAGEMEADGGRACLLPHCRYPFTV